MGIPAAIALRNCFITVPNRDLMLPVSLTKRLVNHARPQDVTEGYAADWTMEQLRAAAPARRRVKKVVDFVRHVRVYSPSLCLGSGVAGVHRHDIKRVRHSSSRG